MDELSWIARSREARAGFFENRARIVAVTTERGTGGDCAYCGKTIDRMSIEHRIEAIVRGGVRTLHFHRVCHHLWESHEQEQSVREAASGNEAPYFG